MTYIYVFYIFYFIQSGTKIRIRQKANTDNELYKQKYKKNTFKRQEESKNVSGQ